MRKIMIAIFMLISAIGCSRLGIFKGWYLSGRYVGDVFENKGVRSLAIAAASGDVEKIRELHMENVDVNYKGKEGITPLFWAMLAGNKVGFEELLKIGADPGVYNKYGSSVLRYVSDMRDTDYLELALKYGGDPDHYIKSTKNPLIHNVCTPGPMRGLELVVEAGADINITDGTGMTPVMTCVLHLQYDKALYLLEKGAKYKGVKDDFGRTFADVITDYPGNPEIAAIQEPRTKVIEFLAKRGVRVLSAEDRFVDMLEKRFGKLSNKQLVYIEDIAKSAVNYLSIKREMKSYNSLHDAMVGICMYRKHQEDDRRQARAGVYVNSRSEAEWKAECEAEWKGLQ